MVYKRNTWYILIFSNDKIKDHKTSKTEAKILQKLLIPKCMKILETNLFLHLLYNFI